MKKIVINGCFGGFGLSHAGVMRYAASKGLKLYRYFDASTKRIYGDDYHKGCAHYTTESIPGVEGDVLPEDGGPLDRGPASQFLNEHYWSDHDIPRDDPALVETVEELGDIANGDCASLRVVEVPDDAEWEIDEYDGSEHVAEKHRTWR
jgi:hypothetical protein